MSNDGRIPYLLTAYGLPHGIGFLPTKDGQPNSQPLTPLELLDSCVELGLTGIEMPILPHTFNHADPGQSEKFVEELNARGLSIIVDAMGVLEMDVSTWRAFLQLASNLGATLVRTLISRILCGDRRGFPGGWETHFLQVAARLNEILPFAQDLGLTIVVENHQDAAIEDLLRLYDLTYENTAFGILLDTGNPLAVGQDPVDTARILAPLIRHLHMKDYTIHFAPEGYRLVRCAAGTGVINFPAILDIVQGNGHNLLPGIEIAAQATRTIPFLETDWWTSYPQRTTTELLPALRLLWAHGYAFEVPYSSAWERSENSEMVCREEWEVVRRSVDYFRRLHTMRPMNSNA